MIEDPTLRDLFRTESGEHLQRLDDALLRLEKNPGDQAQLEDAFREAHSLKGAARMLGLDAVQTLAHQLEDGLNSTRRGERTMSAAILEIMSQQLTELRRRVSVVLAGAPAESHGLQRAQITTAAKAQASVPTLPNAVPATLSGASADAVVSATDVAQMDPTPMPSAPFRIESMRVEPRKLDALMTLTGELTVTKTRVARRLEEIDALSEVCEEWEREEATHRARRVPATDAGVSTARLRRIEVLLTRLRTGASEDGARLDYIAGELESSIRQIRLVPWSNVFRLFPRLVHDMAKEQGKEVEFALEGEDTNADKRILEEMKDPLMHILRNAVDHGIEPPHAREQAGKPRSGLLRLKAIQTPGSVVIEVSDDGRGLDEQAIKRAAAKRGIATEVALAAMTQAEMQALIFAPGLSTAGFVTDVSGRGMGLNVVRTNVDRLKGSIQVDSVPGKGMTITIRLPVTLATVHALIVEVNGHPFGLPVECVLAARMLALGDVYTIEGREAMSHQGRPVSVARLADLLEFPRMTGATSASGAAPCVLIATGGETFGVLVDALLDEREVVLKPQSTLLERVRNIAGATILDSGEICMVLNPHDLLASMRKRIAPATTCEAKEKSKSKKVILLAEDSITTRTQEARILANAGYEVVTAVDGLDAYNQLAAREFDAVVSDINMPNIDGLAFTEKIRREPKYAELPIILVTALASDEDKQRGLDAGANAYITKPAFDEKTLLDCLERLT